MKKIKQGYKQTEIGVIPVDWEVKYFGNICDIHVGRDLLEKNFSIFKTNEYIYPVFSNTVSNYGLYGYYKNPEYNFEGFTVVGRGVGLGTAFYRKAKFGAIGRLLVLKPEKDNAKFLTYYVNNKISIFLESGGIPQLTGISFSKYKIPLPPLPEQKAIAQVLSDTDDLIQALEQKLAKKRAIKQGAMQQLLAPKEDWEVRKLGEVATLKARIGWQGLTTAEYLNEGDFCLVTGTDFKHGFIDWDNCVFVEKNRYDQDKNIQIQVGDILVTKDGTIGKVAFIDKVPKPTTLNSGVFVIRPKNNSFDSKYFYYVLMSNHFLNFLSKLTAGSTISHLYQKDFVHYRFPMPSKETEQIQIATILSDMDTEIEQIETQLSKYKQIKQGLMQNLLTGKIRLL